MPIPTSWCSTMHWPQKLPMSTIRQFELIFWANTLISDMHSLTQKMKPKDLWSRLLEWTLMTWKDSHPFSLCREEMEHGWMDLRPSANFYSMLLSITKKAVNTILSDEFKIYKNLNFIIRQSEGVSSWEDLQWNWRILTPQNLCFTFYNSTTSVTPSVLRL